MANFEPKEFNASDINGGQKFRNGDGISAEAINAPIESALLMQELATTQPQYIENGGSPSVTIENGQFVFANLKGEKGEQGEKGEKGVGIPSGGTEGQILTKTENGTAWQDAPSGGGGISYMSLMESTGINWDDASDYNGYFLVPKGYTNYTFYNSNGYIHLTREMLTVSGTISFSHHSIFGLKVLANPYYDDSGLLQDFYAVRGWNMMYDAYESGMNGTILKME